MSTDDRTSWALLALLAVAQFMVVLDITIVNVALPSIGAGLGFAPADLQWVVTAYVLCSGGLLLVGGRAAGIRRRRAAAGRRPRCRHRRPAADVPRRPVRVHRRVAGVRARAFTRHPGRRARR